MDGYIAITLHRLTYRCPVTPCIRPVAESSDKVGLTLYYGRAGRASAKNGWATAYAEFVGEIMEDALYRK